MAQVQPRRAEHKTRLHSTASIPDPPSPGRPTFTPGCLPPRLIRQSARPRPIQYALHGSNAPDPFTFRIRERSSHPIPSSGLPTYSLTPGPRLPLDHRPRPRPRPEPHPPRPATRDINPSSRITTFPSLLHAPVTLPSRLPRPFTAGGCVGG